MAYRIAFAERADRQLDEFDPALQLRILERISLILAFPRGARTTKLEGYDDVWAVRVGDYRVAYKIDDDEETIRIQAVGHRRDFYRRLRRIPDLR